MDNDLDPRDILLFMDNVIRRAGEAVLSYFRGDFKVDRKDVGNSLIDIVTDADRVSEEIILAAIEKEFPDHDTLSEETPPDIRGSRWKWLVDPLDGTINFAHGFPFFCVSMALVQGDDLLAAMIYDPLRDECFSATRGAGAFLNGTPIRVSAADRLEKSVIATGFPYDRASSPDNNVAEFSRVVTRVQGMRRAGSAAMDLAYVSCGRLDGFWELKLKPWDQGAGMLLVREAGGRVSNIHGEPTDVYTRSVLATNGLLHDTLTAILSQD